MIPTSILTLVALSIAAMCALSSAQTEENPRGRGESQFGVRVVDCSTGKGVPLVELCTVNEIRFFTDNEGWIAFDERELMDREVFFHVHAGGYEIDRDGFGYRGVRLTPRPGERVTIEIKRTLPAERLGRLTGQGRWEASDKLNNLTQRYPRHETGQTLGQDSVQFAPYQGKLFWLWGDTNLAHYPLGNFHTTSAWTKLPTPEILDRADLSWQYLLEPKTNYVRRMLPDDEPGAVWLFGLLSLPDPQGVDALVAHYSRHLTLANVAEQGLARFNDRRGVFEKLCSFEVEESWRFPKGNAVRVRQSNTDFVYFAEPFLHTRVAADWGSLLDRKKYEALWYDPQLGAYRWQSSHPPTTPQEESALLAEGKMAPSKALFQTVAWQAKEPGAENNVTIERAVNRVDLHRGSIAFSAYRNKWVLVANERGDPGSESPLGDVWYGEADAPTGPWRTIFRIATHSGYSFYNPRIHDYPSVLKPENKFLYFEGTFTKMFSPHAIGVPRYEYNQLLYRLNLDEIGAMIGR